MNVHTKNYNNIQFIEGNPSVLWRSRFLNQDKCFIRFSNFHRHRHTDCDLDLCQQS